MTLRTGLSRRRARARDLRASPSKQAGAVLFVSLVLLVILTLLGVSGMNTSSLEERMASNSQEANRAFHAAETGLSSGMDNSDAYDIANPFTPGRTEVADTGIHFDYTASFLDWTPPPAGSLYSATSFQAAHFDFQSEGETAGNLTTVLHGGAYQIAPKAN